MNIDEAREMLVDLLYGELPEHEKQALLEFLRTCPELQAEMQKLQLARKALLLHRAPEPPIMECGGNDAAFASGARPFRLARRATSTSLSAVGRRFPATPWVVSAIAAAAVLLAAFAWVFLGLRSGSAIAAPVEITRTQVSLTILSTPHEFAPPESLQGDVQSSEFLESHPGIIGVWKGLALIRDQRAIRNLPPGRCEVRFSDVPSGILPDSVRLRSLDREGAVTIEEQDYQYDLATADAVLDRYVDKPVRIVFKDGSADGGDLLSFDDSSLTIRPPGQGPRTVDRKAVAAVVLAELPKGLLTRPTLVWKLNNTGPWRQDLEVSYLAVGLAWKADYVLKLRPHSAIQGGFTAPQPATACVAGILPASLGAVSDLTPGDTMPASVATSPPAAPGGAREDDGEIFDSADMVGYATVCDNTGQTFDDAQLKLLAADVHIEEPEAWEGFLRLLSGTNTYYGVTNLNADNVDRLVFKEQSFFEYHLYTLGRPSTIRSAKTKQIELVSGSGIKVLRTYVYDPNDNPSTPRVVSEIKNSSANGMGMPLPKGVIRLYAPDAAGEQTYCATAEIDHTARDETIRLPWGYAFDIACDATRTAIKYRGAEVRESWQYSLRNHKDYDVPVTIRIHVPISACQAECALPWHVRKTGLVEIPAVRVKADSSAVVDFSYRWKTDSGGGLKSPYDK